MLQSLRRQRKEARERSEIIGAQSSNQKASPKKALSKTGTLEKLATVKAFKEITRSEGEGSSNLKSLPKKTWSKTATLEKLATVKAFKEITHNEDEGLKK